MIIEASKFSGNFTSKCLYHLSPFRNFLKFWMNRKRPAAYQNVNSLLIFSFGLVCDFKLGSTSLSVPSRRTASSHCVSGSSVSRVKFPTSFFLLLQGRFVFVTNQVSCIHISRRLVLFFPHIHNLLTLLGLILVVLLFFIDPALSLLEFPTIYFFLKSRCIDINLRLCSCSSKTALPKAGSL